MKERTINGLVTAAGLSTRMGDFKPLLPLGDSTIIERTVDSLLSADVDKVVVVVGYRADEVEAVLRRRYLNGEIVFAYNRAYATTDMLASIQCGLRVMPPCTAFFLLPGDMPSVSPETLFRLRRAMPEEGGRIVFPVLEGRRQHPPLIDAGFIPAILDFQGSGGLRTLWRGWTEESILLLVDDPGCRIDLDTKRDYAAYSSSIMQK